MQSQKLDSLNINSRVTFLESGSYFFRYASKPAAEKSVCIALLQAPLGKDLIDFFPAHGDSKSILKNLSDCISGRVKSGGTTARITEYYLANVELEPVDLRIDRIDTSAAIMRTFTPVSNPPEAAALSNTASSAAGLKLTSDIEKTGDPIRTDQWLGDETGQARLEGSRSRGAKILKVGILPTP